MKVSFFYRRPATGNFSVERIFALVRKHLSEEVVQKIFIPRYVSKGLFTRLYNIVEASFHQSDVNHITGDVHFLSYLLKKNRTVLTILDCHFLHSSLSATSKAIINLLWYQIPARRVALVTTISEFSKKEILSLVKIDPRKVIVIPVPLMEGFTYSPKTFNASKPRILHIGTAPNKNLVNFLPALEGVNCELAIVGSLSDDILSMLRKYKINFTNYKSLSDKEIINQYKKADLVNFTSTYEGFGMPIIEANAIGRPVLTSDLSPMNDVAGGSACLVNPCDIESIRKGLYKIIKDSKFRDKLIKLGLENAKRFDCKAIAAQYEKVYQKLAKNQLPNL